LAGLTYRQLGYWRDAETLWRYTVSVTKNNYVAHDMLGLALDKQGRVAEAITEFRLVETLHKYPPQEIMSLGMFEQANGYLAEALDQYAHVFRESSDPKLRSSALAQSAEIECDFKNYAEGQRSYEQAMKLNPDNADALVGMGLLAWRDGSPSQAAQWFTRAVSIEPRGSRYLLLADALRLSGQTAEAKSAQESAAKTSSNLGPVRQMVDQKYSLFGIDATHPSQSR
jgi:protein O-mannosyl-transferase